MAVGRLEAVEVLLMNADRFLQLLDVLCSSLPESSLSLAIALLPFF